MAKYEVWSVESRLKCPDAQWSTVHNPLEDYEMCEQVADKLVELYSRAMPLREYRKTSRWVDPDDSLIDDDIPF